ncbi:MAG: M48 family metalloprotease [Rhodanobacter sp.]
MTMPARHRTPRLLSALIRVLLCGTACLAPIAMAQDNVRLPDLGSSANALISKQEAQAYGASMLRQMRALDMVVDDPLVDDYINDLGFRLVAACAKPDEHFSFFVVKDPEINAFAAPGGYVAVNAGLVAITRSESELAGVIAHEIGHITQNHLQRAFEASRKDAPLMALVLLGALAAGAANNTGDAPMAVLAGGQGLIAQRSINFTRKDEIEADRTGIQTLANAGFDPRGMASFFSHMQDVLSANAGGIGNTPSMLQDHPVTSDRISDAKSRAGGLIAAQKLRPSGSTLVKSHWEATTAPIPFVRDVTTLFDPSAQERGQTYALMRERLRVLTGDASKEALQYRASFDRPGFDTLATRYGYALALTRSGDGTQAIAQLQPLIAKQPDNLILQLAMAEAHFQAGQRAAALALYEKLNLRSPRNRAVALAYAQALTTGGSPAQAATAAELLRPLLSNAVEPQLYTAYARASEKAGDTERAGEAFADASYYSGRPFDAMEQLKRLLKRDDLDYYARVRIQARIAELTPLVLELHKRKIQTADRPEGDR